MALLTQAAVKIQTCVGADKRAIQCLNSGKSQCECLRTSPTAKECLGVCWTQIEAQLCAAQGSAGAEAEATKKRAQELKSAEDYVRERMQKTEDEAEWMPDGEDTETDTAHHPDTIDIPPPPDLDGACDETTATQRTTDCVSMDEEVKVRCDALCTCFIPIVCCLCVQDNSLTCELPQHQGKHELLDIIV